MRKDPNFTFRDYRRVMRQGTKQDASPDRVDKRCVKCLRSAWVSKKQKDCVNCLLGFYK